MPSNADIDRDYYLGAVSGSSALMTNSDLERAYWLQMLGLSEPNLLTTTDLKYKFYLANATGGNASMSISDLERMYYLAQAGLSEPYNGSISDLWQTVPKGNINLLSANVASGTDILQNTTGFTTTGSTISSSTEQAYYALRSLKCVSTGIAVVYIGGTSLLGTIPVVAGGTYTATYRGYSTATSRMLQTTIYWWTSAGNVAASTPNNASSQTAVNNTWQQYSFTVTAPANAAYCSIRVYFVNAIVDEVCYLDNFGFWVGTSTTWAMPPGSPVWTPVNLLTSNQASIETDTSGFNPISTTLARVIGGEHGSYCLELTATGAGPGVYVGGLTTAIIPVLPGHIYTATVRLKSSASRTAAMYAIYWRTSDGTTPASTPQTFGTNVALSTSWQTYQLTATAPADAAFATMRFTGNSFSVGETYQADKLGFWEGAGGNWVMPPPVLNTAVWRVDATDDQIAEASAALVKYP